MIYNEYEIEYLISNNLTVFHPWEVITGERRNSKKMGLEQRFPNRDLFPFAVKTDCDDVACYDLNDDYKVVVIHDFSSVGWEQREVFQSFWDWFKSAMDDFIEFAIDDIEYEKSQRKNG
jgi:hypothetical protein